MVGNVRIGFAIVRGNVPLWVGLYLGKLVLAAVVAAPLQMIIYSQVDFSILARTLLGEWNLGIIAELIAARPNAATALILVTFMVGGVAFLIKQFLNGGLYATLSGRQRAETGEFFATCGRMFLAHMRISAVMALVYLGLLVVSLVIVSIMPERLFGWWGNGWLYTILARLGVTGALLIAGSIFSDIVRLQAARAPQAALGIWLMGALNHLKRRTVQTIGVYLVYAIPMLIVWLVIERLALVVTGGLQNLLGVVIELLMFQVCSLLGVGQTLLFVASLSPMMTGEPAAEAAHD